ncbi:MAG: glycosyltransferase family 39 protein [Polyangiaceae bacterium]
MRNQSWERASAWVVGVACGLKALVHLLLIRRYGYHTDELYFIECGRHLAWGYVDHPPLIPWIAAAVDRLGGGLFALRLPAVLAGTATLWLSGLLVKLWGGGWRAQLVTLLALLLAPAPLRMGSMLDIPVFEVFLCTLSAYWVALALKRQVRWAWLAAGVSLGLAILAKHASVAWGVALFLGILASPVRRELKRPWPWMGVALAGLMALPNLVWQVQHGYPTLEFMGHMRALLVDQRVMFLPGQVLYFGPLALPVWVAGVVASLRSASSESRPFAVAFLVLAALYLVSAGKPYYLASAYPAVMAAGGLAFERWQEKRARGWSVFVGGLALTGVGLGTLSLPVLSIQRMDATAGALFGWAVRPMELTHDMHRMFGAEERTRQVERVSSSLPAEEQRRTGILAGSYSHAAGYNVYRQPGMPRAVSGNMTYFYWGYDADRTQQLIVFGMPSASVEAGYAHCEEVSRLQTPLAAPGYIDVPVFLCREPRGGLEAIWPSLRSFGHTHQVAVTPGATHPG